MKTVARLLIWADSSEHSLLADAMSTKILCSGPYDLPDEKICLCVISLASEHWCNLISLFVSSYRESKMLHST